MTAFNDENALYTENRLHSLIGAPSGLAQLDSDALLAEDLPPSVVDQVRLPVLDGVHPDEIVATDGTNIEWVDPGALREMPATAGHSGAVLSTDGSVASWQQPASALPPTGAASGVLAGSYPAPTLATTGVLAATYGSASAIPSVTIDAKGRVTGASAVPVQIAGSQVTSLATDLALKAPLSSPALSGAPTAPTPTAGDVSTKIATTAFVSSATAAAVSGKAPLASPAFSGAPTAPTPAAGDSSTLVATTAFINSAKAGSPLTFKGTYDPTTDTPSGMTNTSGTAGDLYLVSTNSTTPPTAGPFPGAALYAGDVLMRLDLGFHRLGFGTGVMDGPSSLWDFSGGQANQIAGGSNTQSYQLVTFGSSFATFSNGTFTPGGETMPASGSPCSIEVWMRWQGSPTTQTVATYGGVSSNAIKLVSGVITSAWYSSDLAGVALSTGLWHHVASTWDGTARRLYLDGAMIASDTPTAPAFGPNDIHIGQYTGDLRTVGVYPVALSAERVLAHYHDMPAGLS